MNKVLRDCIPDITMPFLDDIPIKGCPVEDKDETIEPDGCRKFVADHVDDCEKVMQRLEGARLTFSGEKLAFGKSEICIMAVFTLSLWTPQGWAISIKSIKGSCPKIVTI